MTSAKLGEICTIVSGGTPSRSKSEYWINGTIPWIKIGNIKGKYVVNADENITELGLEKSSAKFLKKGTILYTIFATLGEVGILNIDACTNQAIAGITIKDTTIIGTDFLYYYLKSKKQYVDRIGRGVAQNNINMSILRNFDVPLLSLEKQKDIVSTLDTLQSIITHRRTQLEKLDLLVKARFVEMFGDMIENDRQWENYLLCNIADIVSGITKGRKIKEAELIEVPYMAVSNVKNGYIDWTTVKTILATASEVEQYRIHPEDILMTEGGDPDKLGRGAIIHQVPDNCIHQNHIFRVRLDEALILPIYFSEYLQAQKAKRYFLGCAKQTTGIASINMTQLKALPVLVPPLALQAQFADFVKQVDKSKATVQKALDEAQLLFDSLMQEYFG